MFFTDDISVVLINQKEDSRCYGGVHIRANKATRAVCASSWTRAEAEVVCRELQCGKVGFHSGLHSGYCDTSDIRVRVCGPYSDDNNGCLLGDGDAYSEFKQAGWDSRLCEMLRPGVVPVAMQSKTRRAKRVVPMFFCCLRGLCR